jgi:hypothetical protein
MTRENIPYITVLSLMVSHLFVVYIDKPKPKFTENRMTSTTDTK